MFNPVDYKLITILRLCSMFTRIRINYYFVFYVYEKVQVAVHQWSQGDYLTMTVEQLY